MSDERYFGTVRSGEELEAAYALRTEVFCSEQGVDSEEEFDGLDPEAVHIVGIVDGEVVATCRLLFDESEGSGRCRLGRMAVAERGRGSGWGKRLIAAAETEARSRGAEEILIHAQRRAEGFYAGRAYRSEGGTFIEAEIPHVAMRKRIRRG